ncbi:MAG: chromate transporter [Deltaproteobacteria bacterium]|nr:chromate transporter [Deltaproteobacteria bacterium]
MVLLKLAALLFLANALTIGGGYAMIPMLQQEFVDHYHWLSNKEFLDAIAIGQVTPGPLTVMNAFMGFKVGGLVGALVAMFASYLPCVIIVTLVTKYYLRYKELWAVRAGFAGIKPAVVGLLIAVLIFLSQGSLINQTTKGIAVISFALLTFTKIDPSLIIIGSGILGALLF